MRIPSGFSISLAMVVCVLLSPVSTAQPKPSTIVIAHAIVPIVGHVPDKVRIQEVVEAGQKSIEHLMGIFEGCSTEEDKFIKAQGNLKLLLTTQDQQRCESRPGYLHKTRSGRCPRSPGNAAGRFSTNAT